MGAVPRLWRPTCNIICNTIFAPLPCYNHHCTPIFWRCRAKSGQRSALLVRINDARFRPDRTETVASIAGRVRTDVAHQLPGQRADEHVAEQAGQIAAVAGPWWRWRRQRGTEPAAKPVQPRRRITSQPDRQLLRRRHVRQLDRPRCGHIHGPESDGP